MFSKFKSTRNGVEKHCRKAEAKEGAASMHTTEIVPVERVGNLLADVERLYDAIAAKANQYSDDRGSVEGYHVDDWLRAETELVGKPKYKVIREKNNFTIEMALPETETFSVAIRVTPTGMLIMSKPDDNGRRVF